MIRFATTLLSKFASVASINQVRFDDDGKTVRKRRRRLAFLWTVPGNVILKRRLVPVRVLTGKKWRQREQRIASLRSNSFCQAGKRELIFTRLPGLTLRDFLSGPATDAQKTAAFISALRALLAFHLQSQQSHGDASVSNVMLDRSGTHHSAVWFDFDLAHCESTAMSLRRADDLRSLLFTAAKHFASLEINELISIAKLAYDDAEVWQQFDRITQDRKLSRDIFHRAQLLRQ